MVATTQKAGRRSDQSSERETLLDELSALHDTCLETRHILGDLAGHLTDDGLSTVLCQHALLTGQLGSRLSEEIQRLRAQGGGRREASSGPSRAASTRERAADTALLVACERLEASVAAAFDPLRKAAGGDHSLVSVLDEEQCAVRYAQERLRRAREREEGDDHC